MPRLNGASQRQQAERRRPSKRLAAYLQRESIADRKRERQQAYRVSTHSPRVGLLSEQADTLHRNSEGQV